MKSASVTDGHVFSSVCCKKTCYETVCSRFLHSITATIIFFFITGFRSHFIIKFHSHIYSVQDLKIWNYNQRNNLLVSCSYRTVDSHRRQTRPYQYSYLNDSIADFLFYFRGLLMDGCFVRSCAPRKLY